jgi:ribosome recycling factor
MAETKGEVFSQAEEKMRKAVSVNLEELSTIRSGRATPQLSTR